MSNEPLLEWLRSAVSDAQLVISVCTGALLLGKIGALDGIQVTTHHTAFELLREVAPSTTVMEGVRYVDQGRLITAAGISAGIDASLHVVARLCGGDTASATADQMEYRWEREP